MLSSMLLPFSMALAALASGGSADDAMNTLSVQGCEFGEVYATMAASCDLSFTNSGDASIHISKFSVVSGAGSAVPAELTLAPKATGYVRVSVETDKSAGKVSYIVVFETDPRMQRRSAKVRGFVLSALDQAEPKLEMGVVDLAVQPEKYTVALGSREIAGFRVTSILDVPDWLSAKVGTDGSSIEAAIRKESAPLGLQEGYVRVALNTPRQKEAMIKVTADIHGDVVPSANPMNLGLVRIGDRNEALVRLSSRSHKKLNVGKVSVLGFNGDADLQPCQPASDDCRMIRLRVSDKQPAGSLRGTVLVDLPSQKQQLPISTWGFLVPKSYEVSKVDTARNGAQSKVVSEGVDLADALKHVGDAPSVVAAPPPGAGPLLKWTVADAAGVYGFQIFRADTLDGPFLLLNPVPIPATEEGNESVSYQWRDNSVTSGKIYFYSIGILRNSGQKELLGTPQKVVAK